MTSSLFSAELRSPSALSAFCWVRVGFPAALETEAALDRFTAVFGTGPGYVFQFGQALADVAVAQLGLAPDLAQDLAHTLLAGTVDYAAAHQPASFGALVDDMTRLKGATYAGVNALTDTAATGGLDALLTAAFHAAHTATQRLGATHGHTAAAADPA